MITVRFPSGVAVQYNTANFASRSVNGYTDLYTKKDGSWVAQVPTQQCVVEVVTPGRVYDALAGSELGEQFLAALVNDDRRRTVSTYTLAKIKRALDGFDARRRVWK